MELFPEQGDWSVDEYLELSERSNRLIELNNGGKCLIPIQTPNGKSLGYYTPPVAAQAEAEATLPEVSPERQAELERRLRSLRTTG